jgi:hypothetical protein
MWRAPVIELAMKAHRNSAGNTVASLGVRHPEMPAEFATLRESLFSDLWLMWFCQIRKLEIAFGPIRRAVFPQIVFVRSIV